MSYLKTYDILKEYSLECEYKTLNNPADSVDYPFINTSIPSEVQDEINEKCTEYLFREIKSMTSFLRQSPKGVHCPHVFHNDKSMGDYSLMIYLSDIGGTGLFRHGPSGITYAPEDPKYLEILKSDQCDESKWSMYKFYKAAPNTAAIFDSALMHAALPFGGYGQGKNSRTVMTVFFS